MRFRLLRRRLTISAPRVLVRRHVPWPLRYALWAVVLGFSGALALYAFERGKELAGVDAVSRRELQSLRAEVGELRAERERLRSTANTTDALRTAETAAQQSLAAQVRQLQAENRGLREDLGFFEQLMPAGAPHEALGIRGLEAELAGPQLRWQVLLLQAARNAPAFKGRLELTFSGTLAGKPWSMALPQGPVALQLRQYQRLEGTVEVPPGAVVQTVTARVLDGATTRASQTVKL